MPTACFMTSNSWAGEGRWHIHICCFTVSASDEIRSDTSLYFISNHVFWSVFVWRNVMLVTHMLSTTQGHQHPLVTGIVPNVHNQSLNYILSYYNRLLIWSYIIPPDNPSRIRDNINISVGERREQLITRRLLHKTFTAKGMKRHN
jgi:hypothetical protein